MLPKKYKIKGQYRIQKVLKKGKRLTSTAFFTSYCLVNRKSGGKFPNFSVIIPGRLKLEAVERNLCKRRIYAGIEKLLPLTKSDNYDIVIIAKDSFKKNSFGKILEELKIIFSQL